MTTTLISGANKGLGFETARRLLQQGHHVILGARDAELGARAAERLGAGARFVQLDVTSDASVAEAMADIAAHEGGIDVLINNAGIPGSVADAAELSAADAQLVFDTNVVSIVRMTHCALPLLANSQNPVIVNVSSGMGSFGRKVDGSTMGSGLIMPLYSASKAAVTMLTTQYASALPHIRINAADPGYTGTDFNENRGTQTVREGTDAIVALATVDPDGPTGAFRDRAGTVPW